MRFIHKIVKILLPAFLIFGAAGCDQFDLDINTDPNNPTTTRPNLLLTSIQFNLMDNLAGGMNNAQAGFVGQLSSFDNWNVGSASWNGFWNRMYSSTLKETDGLIEAASENREAGRAENPHYLGIAQLLKAYSYVTMVDLFGDVPFSEAGKGDAVPAIKTPKFDKQEDIYAECKKLVDAAIVNLNKVSGIAVQGDLIYSGDIAKWKKFANSLKFKIAMTTRLVNPAAAKTEIETLVKAGGLIGAASEDFQLQFSKTIQPDNRHPWYQGPYTGGEFTYLSSQMLVEMIEDGDPRFPFYFRRQTKKVLDPNNPTEKGTIPCTSTPGCVFAYVVANPDMIKRLYDNKGKLINPAGVDFLAGIFGRDRADPSGVPADGTFRTLPGVYPAGGFYDVTAPALPAANAAPGGGIFPALMSTHLQYYQIEAALAMGATVSATPRKLFEDALRGHITKVVNYGLATDGTRAVAPSKDTTDKYVALWLKRYDDATTDNAKLNVVMKQLWFSSWGTYYELWNAYRRTGLPTTLQQPLAPARAEPRRMPYPQIELTLNPQAASYKAVIYDKDPVFWDK
jgi:Starch-binding associating with outer membrane/Susd and RagB outer membrane lipoprotein